MTAKEMTYDSKLLSENESSRLSEDEQSRNAEGDSIYHVPSFLLKTFEIVDEKKYDSIISWTEDGEEFVIRKLGDFTDNILPKFFKHNNFSSFIR